MFSWIFIAREKFICASRPEGWKAKRAGRCTGYGVAFDMSHPMTNEALARLRRDRGLGEKSNIFIREN